MLAWMIVNYKKTIAIATAILTTIVLPVWFWALSIVLDFRQSQANDHVQDNRIYKLETTINNVNGKFEMIEKSLQRIEEREYQELKQARQIRQAQKP